MKIGINKDNKIVGIWKDNNCSADITLINVSDEDLIKLRNKAPEDEYFLIDNKVTLVKDKAIIIRDKILKLKQQLKDYDYIGVKIATGRATIEEYSDQISKMNQWAKEINELEDMLNASENN